MVNLFRRYQQPLMIGFTILTIITFANFYTRTDSLDKGRSGRVAEIYGRSVTLAQAQRAGRKADLSQQLGMNELYESLAAGSNRHDARENFIWNDLVLKHESELLGLEPTDDEIVDAVKAMPVFQNNGEYSPGKYAMLTQMLLTPRGFTVDDLNDVVGDGIRLKKVKALLGATAAPAQTEVRQAVDQLDQKTQASIIRFKLSDFLAAAQVPDEEVKKLYEQRKASLNTEELRKVKFVDFTLPPPAKPEEKPLEGKARAEALTELQKKAEDFSVAMTDKNAKFEDAASKLGAKVQETPDFPATAAPADLGGLPEAAAAAFKLTKAQPNSDIIETPRGYYVLQLDSIAPPRPLTFDEAKADLTESLKHDRAQEALNLKATEVRNKIQEAIKAGKTFAAAAQELGVKAEDLPMFSEKEPKVEGPDGSEIIQIASGVKEGEVSSASPSGDGSVIIYVAKRLPVDEKDFQTDKTMVAERLHFFQEITLFQEWLKLRRASAGLRTVFPT
jgi:peptidyl-prolyl cis-trans isomerase D